MLQAWAIGALAVAEPGDFLLDCGPSHRVLLYDAAAPAEPPRVVNAYVYGSSGGRGFPVALGAGACVT